ncbi:MAG: aminotransferase class V-fold PLP-dependent enzyme, partial [Chromatocurvus sp.]
MSTRREFLGTLSAGALLAAAPGAQYGATAAPAGPSALPRHPQAVRALFDFVEAQVPMNAANLCPSPRMVAEAVTRWTRTIDLDCSFQNRARFGELLETSRGAVAVQLGVPADEVALVRNTSEANNIINAGLDLGPGDEVVLWDQNHPTNAVAWDVRAARYGCSVVRVSVPEDPADEDALLAPFLRVLSPRTRVLAVTHISNVSGIRLPIHRLGEALAGRGIHFHVDGAQSWG